jgi:hypothetical protein
VSLGEVTVALTSDMRRYTHEVAILGCPLRYKLYPPHTAHGHDKETHGKMEMMSSTVFSG